MIKTAELTGAQLDYWVARAEGIAAADLSIRMVPRTEECICIHTTIDPRFSLSTPRAKHYSEDCRLTWPLIAKHRVVFMGEQARGEWFAQTDGAYDVGTDQLIHGAARGHGATLLEAICRAVVGAHFGLEVEEVQPC